MKHERPAAQARREFEELNALRLTIEERLEAAVPSLLRYADDLSGGFFHQLTDASAPGRIEGKTNVPGHPSRASTATCAAFLVAAGRWADGDADVPWAGRAASLSQTLAEGCWESAGLPQGNSFTVSFLLEALHDLEQAVTHEAKAGPRRAARPETPTTPTDSTPDPATTTTDSMPETATTPTDSTPDPATTPVSGHGGSGPEQTVAEKDGDTPHESLGGRDPKASGHVAAVSPCDHDQPRMGPAAHESVRVHAEWWAEHLRDELLAGPAPGGLNIQEFPATAFLTYKAVRVLRLWNRLDGAAKDAARTFAWDRLYQESVGVAAQTADADVFELAYAALTVTATTDQLHMTPRERDALRHAVAQFFQAQDDQGHWPRSRELFRYPELGNAYCYEYELLVQMLSEPDLCPLMEDKRVYLTRAFDALEAEAIPLADQGEAGWASGHLNPTVTAPESWTTASGYHYCHELRRFVVDAIRREVFAYARSAMPRTVPSRRTVGSAGRVTPAKIDPERFLDSRVGEAHLRGLLETAFLDPILGALDRVEQGHGLGKRVPNSMILYGPPGTSKTELAKIVAKSLGWPLLQLDPSHLTRDGLDRLHAETNLLFTMLASSERIVVLLDEFDELVQDRDLSGAESGSRFLTTAMLPKIAELANRRRIVYLLATNHIERFDDAISRAGRFDLVVPVMQPTLDEKYRRWPEVRAKIEKAFEGDLDKDLAEVLDDLTYLEFEQFKSKVASIDARKPLTEAIRSSGESATLRKVVGEPDAGAAPVTWKSRVLGEAGRNRLTHA